MVPKDDPRSRPKTVAGNARASTAGPSPGVTLPEGERRHATVVLSDLCGYTQMTDCLDPEEVALLLNRILAAATQIVEAHGGMVNQFVGDQVTALFGVPVSHDDDARRAVASALEMHRLVRRLNEEVRLRLPQALAFHTGINTGLLVTQRRDGREGTFGVTGDAVNTAARLRSAAQPDEIIIGPATHRAVEGFFVTERLGPHALKGKSRPIELHRVVGPAARNWLEAARRRGLSRYAGREREHARLDEWVTDLRAGHGRFVAVIGDPGLGKSRLFFEFRRSAEDGATMVLEGRCEAYGTVTSFHPFLDILRQVFDLRPDDPQEAVVEKVVRGAESLGTDVAARIPVYLYLLSINSAAHRLPPNMLQEQLRIATLDGVSALLAATARRRPAVLLLEDWHWADESSELALRSIARLVAEYPLLIVVSRRPGVEPEWSELKPSMLRLRPLDPEETEMIGASRFPGRALPEGLASFIHERTGGNPFFIEEVCRSLAESSLRVTDRGTLELLRPLEELVMPEAVHAVVRARIDRLDAPVREVLQIAAVLGRVFSLRLLRAMLDDTESLATALWRLEDAELIERLPITDEEQYGFSHSITQDVAYDLLLLQRRSELHARAGAAIEAIYADTSLARHYEMLAEHYARSDNVEKAIHYGERAARKAARTYALAPAQRQYGRVIQLLDTLPETPERLRRQIDLSIIWAAVGVSAPTHEQVATLRRFYEKALEIGYRTGAARCSYWIGWIEHGLGNHSEARGHSERALELADLASEQSFVAHVYLNLGQEAYHEADYVTAVAWLTRALGTVQEVSGSDMQNIVVPNCLGYLALCAAERGHFSDAHVQIGEALAVVRDAGQRQLEASMLTILAWIHTFEGEWAAAVEAGQQMRALGEAIGFPYIIGMSKTIIGTARVIGLGERTGIDILREAVAHLEHHGIFLSASVVYAILAEALASSGERGEALSYVEKAFRRCGSGDRVGEIGAHRALGRVLALDGSVSPERVRECFGEAVARARAQQRPREEALTWLSLGEALLGASDPSGAGDALGHAAALFDGLSMRWHAARARSLVR